MVKENDLNIRQHFYHVWGIIGLSLLGIGLYFSYVNAFKFENLFSSERAVIFFIYLLGATSIWLGGLWLGYRANWRLNPTGLIERTPKAFRYLSAFFLLSTPSILSLYSFYNQRFLPYSIRLVLFWACVFLAIIFVFPRFTLAEYFRHLLIFGLLAGVIFSLNRFFNQVTSYPFSLGWSEGNRIWDYSILFGSNRYTHSDESQIYAFIDRGRAFVWGLPFLIQKLNIFWFRFYDALVKTVPYLLLGTAIIWKKKAKLGLWATILYVIWVFLFLLQGPIYSPLIFIAILTFFAVQQKNIIISMLLVMLAGYLAYLTRFSWVYAPGLWAGMLSLLKINNPQINKAGWKKLVNPFLLGIAGLIGGRYISVIWQWITSKNPVGGESLSIINVESKKYVLSQTLLWDRWWPNATYGPGIIFGIILTTVPILILLYILLKDKTWKLNWIQIFGIVFPLLSFLIVGLVASVKIGGGGDLHNLDMFLITLALLSSFVWLIIKNQIIEVNNSLKPKSMLVVFVFVSLMPILWTLRSGNPMTGLISKERSENILQVIQEHVDEVQAEGGKVLFLDQRQLITFEDIDNLILYDEYEKKLLIENSFRKNEEYFDNFYRDLTSHNFDLILSEILFLEEKENSSFSNENNSWLEWVAIPLSENYCSIMDVKDLNLQLLVPGTDCKEATNY